MRRVRYSVAMSLDGYIAGPQGEYDWIVMDPDIDFGRLMSRFDTFLIAFNPGAHWSYFPSVGELVFTIGLMALEVAGYVVAVKKFPILSGWTSAPARVAAA